ncbi:MAG: hypothetical protein NWF00_10180 [Candidatus Bathyarchaeota archaeon]|nr:hypothetical protein [Candidatus Bathyarchaeota archaeon]
MGLIVFWFVTMLPFVLLVVPALVAVAARAFPSIVPEDVRTNGMKRLPKRLLGTSMIVPGTLMIVIGLTITFASFGSYLPTNLAARYFPAATLILIQFLLYAGRHSVSFRRRVYLQKNMP